MRFAGRRSTAGAFFLWACAAGLAQAPPGDSRDTRQSALIRRGPPPDAGRRGPQLTFQVVVTDAKGGPPGDLRDTDLTIYDDGKRVPAMFCTPLSAPVLAGIDPAMR